MSTAAKAYSYLQGEGYISGTSPKLVEQGKSCLSWYGGDMPPGGTGNSTSDAQAVTDMNAWAAAGAQNN